MQRGGQSCRSAGLVPALTLQRLLRVRQENKYRGPWDAIKGGGGMLKAAGPPGSPGDTASGRNLALLLPPGGLAAEVLQIARKISHEHPGPFSGSPFTLSKVR